ncbi:hypothetical protein TNCV_3730171 [Trichonephila clavipes]|nr:hypothetical protein TNCV_3730171 [Trichonephila clavipes]
MATGSYLFPNYSRSQSEIQGDLHNVKSRRTPLAGISSNLTFKQFSQPTAKNLFEAVARANEKKLIKMVHLKENCSKYI